MGDFILNIMIKFGYLGIFFLIAIENLFPPIPSEVILTFGGFLTTYSHLNIIGVVISSTLGSLVGAIILYFLGNLVNVKKSNLEKTNISYQRYGNKVVLFGRCIPIIRSLISIPAGINKMPIILFLIYTTIGSIIWNSILVCTGALLGKNWQKFAIILSKYSKMILVILIIWLILKYKKRNKLKIRK